MTLNCYVLLVLSGIILYLVGRVIDSDEALETEKGKRKQIYKEGFVDGLRNVLIENGVQEFDIYESESTIEDFDDGVDYRLVKRLFY